MPRGINTKHMNKFMTDEKHKREDKISTGMTQVIHYFLWSWLREPRGCSNWHAETKLSWRVGAHCTLHPLHARWHPSHGFPDRLLDSRWLGVIGESILIHNSRLLWLGGKTHISVLTLLKRHQKGGAHYCRSDIHVSPYLCNKTERRGIFTLHALNFIAFKIRAIVTFYAKCGLLFSAFIPLWGTSWGANS